MKHKTKLSRIALVAGLISSAGTIIALLFAGIQLNNSNSIRNADFAFRFKNDFFTEQTNNLIVLIDNDLIRFNVINDSVNKIEFAYFDVDTIKIKTLTEKFKDTFVKKTYPAYEIDNYLLNHLDDLGEYCKKGMIDIDYVNEGFGYYIECVYNNDQIKQYLHWLESDPKSKGSYKYFGYIYDQLKIYNNKHNHL
jgi:hypothetical protein